MTMPMRVVDTIATADQHPDRRRAPPLRDLESTTASNVDAIRAWRDRLRRRATPGCDILNRAGGKRAPAEAASRALRRRGGGAVRER